MAHTVFYKASTFHTEVTPAVYGSVGMKSSHGIVSTVYTRFFETFLSLANHWLSRDRFKESKSIVYNCNQNAAFSTTAEIREYYCGDPCAESISWRPKILKTTSHA
jgi:hypothetical protein